MLTNPVNNMIDEVHGRRVDHDNENVTEMVCLVKSFKYEDTSIKMLYRTYNLYFLHN